MRLYIDKDNLLSFLKSKDNKNFPFCRMMIINQLDLMFNFTKEEAKADEAIWAFVQELADGAEDREISYNTVQFPTRPLKANCSNGFDRLQRSAIYLLNDEKIEVLEQRGEHLVAGLGKEVETLSRLFFDDYQYEDRDLVKNINKWECIKKYVLPLTDVILIDKYLFSDDTLYESNAYTLMRILVGEEQDKNVNIVVVTQKSIKGYTPNWKNIQSEIRSKLKKKHGSVNVTFVFLLADRETDEHDRTILTNYRRFYSGDSFNYVKNDGAVISKGREWEVSSLARKKSHNLALILLDDIQSKITMIKKRNPDLILGDKVSNYLDFS